MRLVASQRCSDLAGQGVGEHRSIPARGRRTGRPVGPGWPRVKKAAAALGDRDRVIAVAADNAVESTAGRLVAAAPDAFSLGICRPS